MLFRSVLITDGPTTVAMYAGRWDFRLIGSDGSLTCTNMAISLTGVVSGDCVRVTETQVTPSGGGNQVPVVTRNAFTVKGVVTRQQQTTAGSAGGSSFTRRIDAITIGAESNPNDLSFSGEMLSPLSATGTWQGTSGEGTFSATHR